jgi:ubiquitin-conjugating enzyme E2 W
MTARNRILKELRVMENDSKDPGIQLQITDNIGVLFATISAQDNPIYRNSTYKVKILITDEYPFQPPVCQFVKDKGISIPMHPHIYSNGHICLDLLGPAWTPIHTIRSILLSLQSFLASNTRCERPPDDDQYCKGAPKNPAKTTFVYHDDAV